MTILSLLPVAILLADPSGAPAQGEGWTRASEGEGVTVYTRPKKGSDLSEVLAVGLVDASPRAVYDMVRDFASYTKTMPYIEASELLATEEEGRVLYAYNRLAPPLVDKRDYILKFVDESDWQEGKGYLKLTWTAVEGRGPAPVEGIVRVRTNVGYWKLEPRDGGKRTLVSYYVFTDPAGAVPRFLVNMANTSAIPDLFKAVKRHSRKD